jgi:hypothetical protein
VTNPHRIRGPVGWYEALKDAIAVAQKADNLALMRQLLDAQRELLDMQAEINMLRTSYRNSNVRNATQRICTSRTKHIGAA